MKDVFAKLLVDFLSTIVFLIVYAISGERADRDRRRDGGRGRADRLCLRRWITRCRT